MPAGSLVEGSARTVAMGQEGRCWDTMSGMDTREPIDVETLEAAHSVVYEGSVAGAAAGNAARCRAVGAKVFDMGRGLRDAGAKSAPYLQLVER